MNHSECVTDCSSEPNSYADTIERKCILCYDIIDYCLKCINSTICTECHNNYFLKTNKTECMEDCRTEPFTFANDVSKECIFCSDNITYC